MSLCIAFCKSACLVHILVHCLKIKHSMVSSITLLPLVHNFSFFFSNLTIYGVLPLFFTSGIQLHIFQIEHSMVSSFCYLRCIISQSICTMHILAHFLNFFKKQLFKKQLKNISYWREVSVKPQLGFTCL